MAILTFENGKTARTHAQIQNELAPLGIGLAHWPIPATGAWRALLDKAALTPGEKEQALKGFDPYFQKLKAESGYQAVDMIALYPEFPELDKLLAQFIACHTHDDDEVRYIVDGEGVFGFVRPDGSQVELTVAAEDYINVPKNVEHWFHLTPARRIKAVRYFTGKEGWVPRYTGTPLKFKLP